MNNTLKAPQSCGTCLGSFSIVFKGHKRIQNRFSLHVSCTTVTYICIFFPGFNAQLLSSWTMIADKIIRKLLLEVERDMEWGEKILLEKVTPSWLKRWNKDIEAIFWAFHTRQVPHRCVNVASTRWNLVFVQATLHLKDLLVPHINMYLCSYLEQGEHKRFSIK